MTTPLTQLSSITKRLLATPLDYTDCRNAAFELKTLFESAVDFVEDKAAFQHIQTSQGRAVSPVSASVCIIDFMRTRVFLQGITDAIAIKRAENPHRPVRILYAGCGPFATLVTPLTSFLEPRLFRVQLLDLNAISLAYLRRTIAAFKMQDYVEDIIHADATQYHINSAEPPDIIISETMLQALAREPMVNIFAHLAPQCPHAIMIPEQVRVDASLYSNPVKYGHRYQVLTCLLNLTAETARHFNNPGLAPAVFNKGIAVKLPRPVDKYYQWVVLLTYLRIFRKHELLLNESCLTLPFMPGNSFHSEELPEHIRFRYERGPVPGFVWEKDVVS